MQAIGRFLAVLFILVLAPLGPISAAAAEKNVIIGFRQKPGAAEQAYLHGLGAKVKHPYRLIPAMAAKVPEHQLGKIKKDRRVAYVEDDAQIALIEPAAAEVEYQNAWGVDRVGAALLHDQGWFGQGVRIAVLDTGIDYTHPELTAAYRGGANFIYEGSNDPFDDSRSGHGTHVAGILAAAHDGSGVVGMAPGVDLYAVKVLDGAGFGSVSALIAGLEWAVFNQMDIVNSSLGTTTTSLALEQACRAVDEAGLLLVAAAGNSQGGEVLYPARYESVVAVSATLRDDSALWSSSVGPEVEMAAPGGEVLSTLPGGGYGLLSGTSQAAPHVAGLAALLLSIGLEDLDGNGLVDVRDARRQLQESALDLGEPGRDPIFGFGLVQAVMPEGPASYTFILTRLQGPATKSEKRIELPGGNYQVAIINDSLTGVAVEVYDLNGLRPDLSQSIRFKKTGPEALLQLDSTDPLTVAFIPEGRVASSAQISVSGR